MSKLLEKQVLPPPSLRERQRSEREDAILGVALAMISESGYAAMTMDDLAARANVSKPTLYSYFSSKEEVAIRAMARTMADSGDYLDGLRTDQPAFVRIEMTLRYLFNRKFVERSAHFCTVRDALGPALRAHPAYRTVYGRLVGQLTVLVDEAKQEGSFAPDLVTRIAVQAMFSFLRDAEYIDLIERGEIEGHAVIDTLVAILLDGFRAKDRK